ncbi:hypothetical protein POL68_27285 [Stigmatella sp. ncwal1]|uniref:Uncharacterized protein n=1 Tax=Stigmatella ashevillensis TaxID=2995309 RepID=A0ABT5DIN5_9BACT|nr:hypothetical protein [Stigmatella ashevillena]MDC0712201.1 hypothetical protein [Stigmatella ashevillena]
MRQPVCILREQQGLVALVLPEEAGATGLLRVPLQELTEQEVRGRTALLSSWEALAQARGATAETLTHALRVLLGTVAGEESSARALEHPWLLSPPAPHRRTAAHPRGYRGTLYQPPKRRQPKVLDVRPYLLHRRGLQALLETLSPSWDEAVGRLALEGYSPERLGRAAVARASSGRTDVALAYHHGFLEPRGAELPAAFVRLGQLLVGGAEGSFARLLALRGRLALDTEPAVLLAAARLLRRWEPGAGLRWLETAARLNARGQEELLAALGGASVAGRVDAGAYDLAVEALAQGDTTVRASYLQGLAAGLPGDYLLSGLRLLEGRLAAEYLAQGWPARSGFVPEEPLEILAAHVEPEASWHGYLRDLWALCGELPGFGECIATLPLTELTPGAALALVELLGTLREPSVERKVRLRWWTVARRLLPPLVLQLRRTSASHQARCVHMAFSAFASDNPPWEGPEHLMTTVLALAERVCGPPFQEMDRLSFALEPLIRHPSPEVRQRLLTLPERNLAAFERSCARSTLAALVGEGMALMVPHGVEWALAALERCPEALGRTAQLLGTLFRHVGREVLADFARHPLVQEDPFALPPERMALLLREHCTGGVDSPLPRKARLAVEEGRALSPGQLARALRVASEGLPRLRLQVLEQKVLERLRGGLPADVHDPRVRHALQMVSLLQDNRRALRRLLARYFAGGRDFIVRHPVSQAWFARHPRVEPERWMTGLVLRHEVPGMGGVTLSLEQDVLEALRLGTHVGSCLALNGTCDYSAAAVVLDVNKRVLYARDGQGRILARQLLAISRDEQLVPFGVYPESTPQALQAVFLDYDFAFAEALGLSLAEGPSYPEVDNVLSEAFWHDGAWELGRPEGP